ncbi:uncharacterized protein RAG0_15579 [Rhynchosporium agropyri]|uniref:Uncharacterized protein n=2 Tax=Rhynchosporium TaxID=38037 RepID=A0A1E1MV67_RHYSE|nr:uncharacterized protein RAG0_15579 [Rhynchosporium agropyri]CZT52966.1 uncharacterized protein RSE6_14384 [Rhynchosporium secalis]
MRGWFCQEEYMSTGVQYRYVVGPHRTDMHAAIHVRTDEESVILYSVPSQSKAFITQYCEILEQIKI